MIPIFLDLFSTKQRSKCLAQGYNAVSLLSLEHGQAFDLKSNRLTHYQ